MTNVSLVLSVHEQRIGLEKIYKVPVRIKNMNMKNAKRQKNWLFA
jgi:hypothetical protein